MAYENPSVRHLAWCLFSEPMARLPEIQNLIIEPSPQTLEWLDELDQNPSPLVEYINSNNGRLLGSYFECLWQYFFIYGPHWRLLKHHLQVFEGKQTLGELDILASNHIEQNLHIELAVKFYLLTPKEDGHELNHWLGPQSHDRLDKKLSKLANKQFPIILHPQTLALLSESQLPKQYQSALALKGYLFKHISMTPVHYHEQIHSKGHLCDWLHHNECPLILDTDGRWAVLPKHQWLGPYKKHSSDEVEILSSNEARTYIQRHFNDEPYAYALMLVKLDDAQEEAKRFIIVHNQWPTPMKLKG